MNTWNERLNAALAIRKKAGWAVSNAELARKAGVSRPTVGDWLHGHTKMMDGDNSAIICDYLQISPVWLFHGKGKSGLEEIDKLQPKQDEVHQVTNESTDAYLKTVLHTWSELTPTHKDLIAMLCQDFYSADRKVKKKGDIADPEWKAGAESYSEKDPIANSDNSVNTANAHTGNVDKSGLKTRISRGEQTNERSEQNTKNRRA